MTNTIFGTIAIVALGIVSISNPNSDFQNNDQPPAAQETPQPDDVVEKPSVAPQVQDPPTPDTPEAPEEPQTPDTPEAVPSPESVMETPVPGEYVPVPESVLPESVLSAPMAIESEMPCGSCCCQPCCCQPVCCTPGPVPTTFCIVDPCSCCSYEICVDVPACCVGNQPAVKWRGGIFGRRVARLCWTCCNKRAKVVITRRGKVRVRG